MQCSCGRVSQRLQQNAAFPKGDHRGGIAQARNAMLVRQALHLVQTQLKSRESADTTGTDLQVLFCGVERHGDDLGRDSWGASDAQTQNNSWRRKYQPPLRTRKLSRDPPLGRWEERAPETETSCWPRTAGLSAAPDAELSGKKERLKQSGAAARCSRGRLGGLGI